MAERSLTRDLESNFPSNSNKSKEVAKSKKEPEEDKKKPIAKARVIVQKKSFGKRFLESFLGDESTSVGDYLINDILVPALKGTVSDLVGGGLDMWLGIDTRNRRSPRDKSGRYYTNYTNSYNDRGRDSRREYSRESRSRHDFGDIVLSRAEAEEVRDALVDLVIEDGVAAVADFYDMVGVESTHADHKYGWTSLKFVDIDRSRDGGYTLRLPRPRTI